MPIEICDGTLVALPTAHTRTMLTPTLSTFHPSLPPSLHTFQISSHHFLLTKWLIVDVDVERAVDAAVTVGAEVADAAATADAEAADADVGAGVGAGVTTVTSGSR